MNISKSAVSSRFPKFRVLAASLAAGLVGFSAHADIVPLTVTGFNTDLIYDAATHTASTTAFVDGTGNAFAFADAATTVTAGTGVTSGVFESAEYTGLDYQFADFGSDNALLLNTASATGTLTLAQPAGYDTISILATGINVTATDTRTVTLNFTDGTTATFPINTHDWMSGTDDYGVIAGGSEKYSAGTWALNGTPTVNSFPAMYDTLIDLSAYEGLKLSSLTFNGGTYAANAATAVFAVSGEAVDPPTILFKGKKKIVTTKSKLALLGSTTGEVSSVTYVNGKTSGTAGGTELWKFNAKLKKGKNKITVTAHGSGGDSSPITITVTRS